MPDVKRPLLEAATEVKFCALDLKGASLDGTFEGYASLFNREDLGRDVVKPGAFRKSLRARGPDGVKLLFQHDPNQPIGIWERLHEDARGLFARGRLMPEVARAREVLALMRAGAIDGLSIGFRAARSVRDRRTGTRHLHEVDLWEISIVTFPMLADARVASVKSPPFADHVPSVREFERWLTRDAGFTRSEASALMRDGFKGLALRRDAGRASSVEQELTTRIAEAAALLRSNRNAPALKEVKPW
ncbi:MAG: HK97 family phage prohead protease [Pseudomonadota bacterium]